ncbi:hypothetical protein DL766_006388 [Monosporascus sp. MC13-8B]|uniref:Uncharacterized protein n=1 Tax=Monosporascus cannonballus TaxID=155416 RepID=A0ABY0GTG6_9PEZI|nr:hypothetical protein DL762_009709 [Monosporascus cannonballus]RYO77686.1 hypothetical protein DL763_009923 [Monosporascus cannonballus]RYP27478.1 hypothetical protein DL766_006388 [Monosporascus sp. MC13-8B]
MPAVIVAECDSRPRQQRSHLGGIILWLPKIKNVKIMDDNLAVGLYQHPVVILSAGLQDGKVDVLFLTSFNETPLELRHPHDSKARRAHLPIEPCSPHPDNGKLLTLENRSPGLRKNSYVKTRRPQTVTYANLQPYDLERPDVDFALSRRSFQELIEYAKFSVPLPDVLQNDLGICSAHSQQAEPVARRYSDVDDGFVDFLSGPQREGVSEGNIPALWDTWTRHEEARPAAATAQTRPKAKRVHMRYQRALLEAVNEYHGTHVHTHVHSHTRTSIYSDIPTERPALLPVHNHGGYGTPGPYRHYGSSTRHAAVRGAMPPRRKKWWGCFGAILRGLCGVIHGFPPPMSRIPWGKVSLVAFILLLLFWVGYGAYGLNLWTIDAVKTWLDTVGHKIWGIVH